MTDLERLDLRSLDPDTDPAARARFVDAVMSRVATRPMPAVLPADPLIGIWSMARHPALAAGIIIVLAVGTVGLRLRGGDDQPQPPQTLEQAVGVPLAFLASAAPPHAAPR